MRELDGWAKPEPLRIVAGLYPPQRAAIRLDIEERLQASRPVDPPNGKYTSLIHLLERSNKIKEINVVIERLTGLNIYLSKVNTKWSLFTGQKEIIQDLIVKKFTEEQEVTHLEACQKITEEGSGYRNIIVVVVAVLVYQDTRLLLDEVETYLSSSDAYSLGKWLGTMVVDDNNHYTISTHSSHFLSGLIDGIYEKTKSITPKPDNSTQVKTSGNKRYQKKKDDDDHKKMIDDGVSKTLTVLRLNRNNSQFYFWKIDNESLIQTIEKPVPSAPRIIEGLFYKYTIICESDKDRLYYHTQMKRVGIRVEKYNMSTERRNFP
jgi:hypothetical protein